MTENSDLRTIGVVTVARSDYGYYLPVLRKIQEAPELKLHLMVAGMHLSPEFGSTGMAIENDGFCVAERIEFLLSSDTPAGISKSMGLGTIGFAQAFSRLQPDILLVLGDRFEMHAAVIAAVPFLIPIAHIGGGAVTVGAIDDSLRHSITKMGHLHFVETETEANRIVQMGEAPWRVVLTGAASLDNLREMSLLDVETLSARLELDLSSPTVLVTYHPVTMEYHDTEAQVEGLLAALTEADMNVIFTYPNADTHGRRIIEIITAYSERHPQTRIAENLGTEAYFSLMGQVSMIVGNSSSGIIEAASFKLPVVNIGTRQQGRTKAENVINVGYQKTEILSGINKARSAKFRQSLTNLTNPYGDGNASARIVDTLKTVPIDDSLLRKGFYAPVGGVTV